LDSSAAEQGVDQLMQKARDVRATEFADQQKMVQDLATMSVEEFDRQIEAQGRLLDKLRIKQESMGDEERIRIVQEYAERKKVFEDTIKGLDEEANKIAELHAKRVQELEELRWLDGPEEMEQRKAREIELEKEISKIVAESRDNYIARTEEAYKMEEDRLKALQELATQGAPDEAKGGPGFADALKGLPGQLDQVGAKAQHAMAPLLKILGPVGIAFSLEQVVEKLFKANEELRVIRNNYAEIAASMGELANVGEGVYVNPASAALMSLQREFTLQYGGGIDPKMIPQVASTLMTQGGMAGVDPETLRKVVEETARIGVVAGNPQEVAQVGARLYREFHVEIENVTGELALLKESAEEANVPFADLARNTLMLAEQTRIYGFDIEDSRRLVTEFSHELHNGTLSMQDLIQVQRATADMPEQQRLGLVAYMDRLSRIVGELPGGENLGRLFDMVGGAEAQGAFMQFIQQGQVPTPEMDLLRSLPEDSSQRQAYGAFFNMESGMIQPGMSGVGGDIRQAATRLVDELALEMSGGSVGRQRVLRQQLMRMFTPEMADKPIAEEEAMRGVVEMVGRGGGVGEGGDIVIPEDTKQKTREASLAALVKISDELLENRQNFADGIKAGMSIWWQDVSKDINTFFNRALGSKTENLLADWGASPEGGAFMGATREVLGPGTDVYAPGKVSFQQMVEISEQVAVLADGNTRQAKKYMEDLVRMLVKQGALGHGLSLWDVEGLVEGFISAGEGESRRGLSPEEQLDRMDEIYSNRYRKRVEDDVSRLGKQRGTVDDVDTTMPGLQVHLGGVTVTVFPTKDRVTREELTTKLDESRDEIIDMVIREMNNPNNGGK